jgi:WD40 repeat protein
MSWIERVREVLHTDVREFVPRRAGPIARAPGPRSTAARENAVAPVPATAANPSPPSGPSPGRTSWTEVLHTPVSQIARSAASTIAAGAAAALDLRDQAEPAASAANLPLLRAGDRIGETYEIRRVISRTATAAVYLAHHAGWNLDVVLRVPIPGDREPPPSPRSIAERAAPWTALGLHPHIAYCHYIHDIDGVPMVVVEYVEGADLRQWFGDGRSTGLRAGLNVAIQICHALEHLHATGVVHGAVTPENVLVAPDGTAKLTDIGVARWGQPPQDAGPPAGNGAAARARVQASYVAPEQWVDPAQGDGRVDTFALGVCLYELFCGGRPYDVTRGPRREAPEPRPARRESSLPGELGALLRRCVDWDRDQRPTAEEMRRRFCWIYENRFGKESVFAELAPTPVEADGWNNRGLAASFLGQQDEATAAWDAAVGIDPAHAEATYNRGVFLWRRARATDEEVVQQLVRTRGAQPWKLRYLLALVHLESGQPEVAVELLEEAERENPESPDIAAALSLARSDEAQPARPLRAFQGHGGYVSSVCFSPDGRHIFSGGADQSVRQWDTETGRCVRNFDGHSRHVASVGLSSNGRSLLTSSDDGTLRVWDVGTGRCLQVQDLGAERIFTAALSGDGRLAAAAFTSNAFGASGTGVELWDLPAKRRRATLTGHAAATKVVALSADGAWAATGGDDKTVRVWDAATGREARVLKGHLHFVSAVAISADAQWIVSGSWDKTIRLWELATGRTIRLLSGHSGLVNAVCVSADNRWILSGGWDGTVRLWEAATGRCLRTFTGHSSMASTVAFSPTGAHAASGSWDRTIRLYQIPASPLVACSYQLSESWRHDIIAARQAKGEASVEEMLGRVRTALEDGNDDDALEILRRCRGQVRDSDGEETVEETARLWRELSRVLPRTDLRDVRIERTIPLADEVRGGDLSADGRHLVTGGRDEAVRLWNATTGECLRTFTGHSDRVLAARIRADGQHVLSASADHTLRLWNAKSGESLQTLTGHTGPVAAVCFGPDGRAAASAGWDHTVRLWNLEDGSALRVFRGHSRQVTSVAVTNDGVRLVSGAYDNTVRLWEARTGRCLRALEGHARAVTSVSLSPDGGWALSGSQDRGVRLWDLRSGRCIRVLEGHEDTVSAVQFSPEGRWAFSASFDQTVRIWDLSTGRCWGLLEGYRDRVTCLRLSGDGLWLLSGCADKTARLWELDWELEAPGQV